MGDNIWAIRYGAASECREPSPVGLGMTSSMIPGAALACALLSASGSALADDSGAQPASPPAALVPSNVQPANHGGTCRAAHRYAASARHDWTAGAEP